uniref:Uncharacterized protein n=1 Tax=Chrysemys picta bellii TaxID=8478 RepID=A0A8C3F610_CHRPI
MRGIPLSDSIGKMMSCKLVLVLTLWTVSTEAFPKGAQRKKCHLSKYKSLPPRELETFKNVKDRFEDIVLLSNRKCDTKIFHRNWEVKELSVHDRVILVENELDFTINVLENVEDPSLSKLLSRPLEILTQIRGDLRDCVRSAPLRLVVKLSSVSRVKGCRFSVKLLHKCSSQPETSQAI